MMAPLDRRKLEQAKRENVRRLAKWLGLGDRTSPEFVSRHLAEQNMNASWPPSNLTRQW